MKVEVARDATDTQMSLRRFLPMALLATAALGVGSVQAAPACGPLKQLVARADEGFARLRGFFDPRFGAWVATYRMPGASICIIQDTEDITLYTCTWKPGAAAGRVDETYTRLLRQVTSCLDVRDSDRLEPDAQTQLSRFGLAGNRESVLVGKSESPNEGNFVTLEILPIAFEDLPHP